MHGPGIVRSMRAHISCTHAHGMLVYNYLESTAMPSASYYGNETEPATRGLSLVTFAPLLAGSIHMVSIRRGSAKP